MDITNYPDDEHTCYIAMETWMYHLSDLKFVAFDYLKIKTFTVPVPKKENSEWKFVKIKCANETAKYGQLYGEFSKLICFVTLRRRNDLLHHYVRIPYAMAVAFSLFMMLFPPNSRKRFLLGFAALIILVSLILFLTSKLGFMGNKGVPKISKEN